MVEREKVNDEGERWRWEMRGTYFVNALNDDHHA